MFQTEATQRLVQPTSSNTGILLSVRLNYLQSSTGSLVGMQYLFQVLCPQAIRVVRVVQGVQITPFKARIGYQANLLSLRA